MWIVVEAAQSPQAIEKGQAHRGFFFVVTQEPSVL